MEAIITAATVLASYLNMAASAQGNFAYNAAYADGNVSRVEVYADNGAQLVRKLEHRYQYDAAGRLVSDETLAWDSQRQEWTPRQVYTYEYADGGYSLTSSMWDGMKRRYVETGEKTVYRMLGDNLFAVDNYRRQGNADSYERVSGMVLMTPQRDIALM